MIEGEPYFVARDVSNILGYRDASTATRSLDEDEKLLHTMYVAGQNRKTVLINESGLYNLIFGSRKEEAKEFKKWITSKVLPTIRKTGGYIKKSEAINFVNSWLPQLDETTKGVIASTLEMNRNLIVQNETLTTTIEEQAPKIEAYQHLLDSTGHMGMGDFAKHIDIGRNTFLRMLRDDDVLMKGDKKNIPKQRYMKYFKVVSKPRRNSSVYDAVALLNVKGVDYFTKKYAKKKMQQAIK